MPVELRLHGTLAAPGRGPRSHALPAGRALLELLRDLNVSADTFSILTINGELVPAQAVPADGDVVDVYPPLCGGNSSQWRLRSPRPRAGDL